MVWSPKKVWGGGKNNVNEMEILNEEKNIGG